MQERKISQMEFEALVRGFTVTESEGWKGVSPEEYSHFPAVLAYPEAFSDGVRLKKRVNMIVSCDSSSEFERDKASYDNCVNELNEKYGRVAILTGEMGQGSSGYGIIGYRFSPFKSVTTTTYTLTKDGKRETEVSVSFPQTEVEMEDEKVRKEMGFEI